MVYFKNESGTGVVFLALCMYLMVIIDNSLLFCLYIFVLEDLAFFPTVMTEGALELSLVLELFSKVLEESVIL